ncbi:MAG: cobalamin biosynthesis protein CobD [Candidatus Rokubacteria bacterium]|nr:cobalamin biosynthesis protein CobD [Candidatus Rokubacteria bacterium]
MRGKPGVLLLAVGLDLVAGEPPDRWHPVAWIGRALGAIERRLPARTMATGGAAVLAVAVGAAGAGALVAAFGHRLGWPGVALEAFALKPAFAARRLGAAALEVGAALATGRLHEARELAGRHLVSRETRGLDAALVGSAAVESVAENLADSVAGPLLAYGLGGLPAAWAYRVLNTADAMWGYRDHRYERFGKAAARLDDAANLVPARLAAGALVVGAALAGEDGPGAARVAWRDHGRTASPNAGWPMAAMAGALGIGLAKPGAYRLGDGPLPAGPDAVGRAVRVFAAASALVVGVALALTLARREAA